MDDPVATFDPLPLRKREWSWAPLGVSAIMHALVMLFLVVHSRQMEEATDSAPVPPAAPVVSLPPYQLEPPPAPNQPKVKQTPPEETPLGPDSKKPDEPPVEAGPEKKPLPDPDLVDPSKRLGEAAPPATTVEPEKEAATPTPPVTKPRVQFIQGPKVPTNGTLLTQAVPYGIPVPDPAESKSGTTPDPTSRVMAASKSAMGRVGFQSSDGQLWQPSAREAAGKCPAIPDLGKDANGRPVLATVTGKVFWEDHVTPLQGAHLQIMGTGFTTFSDNHGEYELRFDPNLLEKCKTQYVKVEAPGFSGVWLTLSIGSKIRSDDVLLRRR